MYILYILSILYITLLIAYNTHYYLRTPGIVLHGPSGSGKTALSDWLAHITRRHCRFLSVPCADLVHKVREIYCLLYICSAVLYDIYSVWKSICICLGVCNSNTCVVTIGGRRDGAQTLWNLPSRWAIVSHYQYSDLSYSDPSYSIYCTYCIYTTISTIL